MLKLLKIDSRGYLLFGNDIFIQSGTLIPPGYTDIPLPVIKGEQKPFYKPRLVNGVWEETITDKELEDLNNQETEMSDLEKLRLDMARSNAELFESLIFLTGN